MDARAEQIAARLLRIRACAREPLNMVNLRQMFFHMAEICMADAASYSEFAGALRCLRYDLGGGHGNTISLSLTGDVSVEADDKLPSITLETGDWNFRKTGVGNRAGDDTLEQERAGARMCKVYRIPGLRVSYKIRARSSDQAAALAHVLLAFVIASEELFSVHQDVTSFMPAGMTAPVQEKGNENIWISQVAFDLDVTFSLSVNFESHILKTVSADLKNRASVDT